ncbi:MAG: ATP-binding cassette domain-containing protein, partial [Pseudomonadota bacterium]
GKTTTLRMIAGLEDITSGDLYIGDNRVNDIPPGDRGVAMVFQDYALYPHMTVYENMAFSLRLKKNFTKEEIDTRVQDAAKMLDLGPYLERKPAALSGGQRQRVAMGRAITKKADVFLFDEPLSNLDAKLRSKMRTEIKRFHMMTKTTTIYVTHDQLEAMTLADRIVVMNDGVVEQVGNPMDVYEFPKSIFVATFIGSPGMNLLPCTIKKQGGFVYMQAQDGAFSFKLPPSKASLVEEGMNVVMGIRPSDIFVAKKDDKISDEWKAKGLVELVELLGKNAFISLKIGSTECLGEIMGRNNPTPGEEVLLSFNLNHIHLFDPNTQMNLYH